MASGLRQFRIFGILYLAGLAIAAPHATDLWNSSDGRHAVSLDSALKWSSLLSRAPHDPVMYPERWTAAALLRARLGLNVACGETLDAQMAYEHSMRLVSDTAAGGAGILPQTADAPYRLDPLDATMLDEPNVMYGHELDRAFVSVHPRWGEVTVGRQAIGLGRGALFGAVDVFSPFSPLDVDREWRRGVDGVRVECEITDTVSGEILSVAGETWDESALLGRVRGYVGNLDGELIIGKRAGDAMYAATASAAVGDAEVHGEIALFETPESHPDGGLFGNDNLVGKAVCGASYVFDVGDGLTVLGEYHYSGFGAADIDDATVRLLQPRFLERYLRGDAQILGQHAVALQASCPVADILSVSLLGFVSPVDGSGIAAPSLVWDFAENVSLIASGYAPWGRTPDRGRLRSEYGGSPASVFLQIALYY